MRDEIKRKPYMAIGLPDEALPDLLRVANADEGFFSSLLSQIKESKPALRPTEFRLNISRNAKSPEEAADIAAVCRAALALYPLKEKGNLSAIQLAEVVGSFVALKSKPDSFAPAKKDVLVKRLTSLLDNDASLGVTAKASDVMTEHERIFCEARILSDIRPVFSGDPATASAAVIIHNLQLGFHSEGKHHEIYVALDTADIQTLKDVLVRAEKKTAALEVILQKSGTTNLRV